MLNNTKDIASKTKLGVTSHAFYVVIFFSYVIYYFLQNFKYLSKNCVFDHFLFRKLKQWIQKNQENTRTKNKKFKSQNRITTIPVVLFGDIHFPDGTRRGSFDWLIVRHDFDVIKAISCKNCYIDLSVLPTNLREYWTLNLDLFSFQPLYCRVCIG